MKRKRTAKPGKPLDGHTAMITGGLGDIGLATAQALRQHGARVALGDLQSRATAAKRAPRFHYTRVDTTRRRAIQSWIRKVEVDLGTPDLIIANAGIVELVGALESSEEAWRRTLDINLTGAFTFVQAACRHLIRKKMPGRVVLVGSWAAHAPHPKLTAYSVAKAGLRMLGQCLALELAPHRIIVNEIAPGFVDAGLTGRIYDANPGQREKARELVPSGELIQASEVGNQIAFLCDPANRHMVGSVHLMDGGLSLRVR
ncbi:MAG: SDR family NAD(P)-dependent oxidoreductase [Verrucomicrobia bacterium]|nr:MAG: SDR family NAD(P)-dependent oxidoreductase [Verrucomicrobiota bacterium]